MRRFIGLVLLLLVCGCGGAAEPSGPTRGAGEAPGDARAAHSLQGRIWDVAAERAISRETLFRRLVDSRFVLLGERHDNPEHHRIQAEILRTLGERGRRPAVVFEMLQPSDEEALKALQPLAAERVDELADAVDWAHSGWPAWRFYRPVFRAALQAGMPIAAGNLEAERMNEVVKEGVGALDPAFVERFGLKEPLPPELQQSLRTQIEAGHCGMLPERMVGPMVRAQRARDARLAEQMLARATDEGAVLIAGAEHVRADRGVPWYLRAQTEASIASLGILEVDPGASEAAEHARATGDVDSFDYLWLTAAKDRGDPCEALRERFSRLLVRRQR